MSWTMVLPMALSLIPVMPQSLGDGVIWLLTIGLCSVVFGVYLVKFRQRVRLDGERLQEARALGIDKPAGQFPYIDPVRCIGCGTCVAACPEGDVLGLVGGQAVVVNGLRCIGIGECEIACPVGAIEVGLGDVRGRADLPVLSECHETSVPGLYIAGELGGLSLVRNAIFQGRATVLAIRDKLQASARAKPEGKPEGLKDLVIVGAGPAGLSAALTAVEAGLDYVVVDQEESLGGTIFQYPRRKMVHTQPVEIPLYGSLEGSEHTKEELLELFQGLAEKYRLNLAFGQKVVDILGRDGSFEVKTETHSVSGRYVILALGRRGSPRKLGVPGEGMPKVLYQLRDAELYKGERILCVGGGDSAVEAAIGLAQQPGNQVTLSYRKNCFSRIKKKNQETLERHIELGSLSPVYSSTVEEIFKDRVRLATPDGQLEIENDHVFIFAGGTPPYGLVKEAGVRFGDEL